MRTDPSHRSHSDRTASLPCTRGASLISVRRAPHPRAARARCLVRVSRVRVPNRRSARSTGAVRARCTQPSARIARALAGRLRIRCAVSAQARETAKHALGGEYELVGNGVEYERFASASPGRPRARRSCSWEGTRRRKGLRVLLEAFAGLGESGLGDSDAACWIAGHGPETEELNRLTRRAEPCGGSAGSTTKSLRAGSGGRRSRASHRSAASPSGSCLLEAMAARVAGPGERHPGYTRPPALVTHGSSRPTIRQLWPMLWRQPFRDATSGTGICSRQSPRLASAACRGLVDVGDRRPLCLALREPDRVRRRSTLRTLRGWKVTTPSRARALRASQNQRRTPPNLRLAPGHQRHPGHPPGPPARTSRRRPEQGSGWQRAVRIGAGRAVRVRAVRTRCRRRAEIPRRSRLGRRRQRSQGGRSRGGRGRGPGGRPQGARGQGGSSNGGSGGGRPRRARMGSGSGSRRRQPWRSKRRPSTSRSDEAGESAATLAPPVAHGAANEPRRHKETQDSTGSGRALAIAGIPALVVLVIVVAIGSATRGAGRSGRDRGGGRGGPCGRRSGSGRRRSSCGDWAGDGQGNRTCRERRTSSTGSARRWDSRSRRSSSLDDPFRGALTLGRNEQTATLVLTTGLSACARSGRARGGSRPRALAREVRGHRPGDDGGGGPAADRADVAGLAGGCAQARRLRTRARGRRTGCRP